jgi:hypothetical protein
MTGMDVTDALRDAAYAAVGFTLIGINKVQVARREALRRIEPGLAEGWRAVSRWCAEARENLTGR